MDKILKNLLIAMIAILALGLIGLSWEWISAKQHKAQYYNTVAARS